MWPSAGSNPCIKAIILCWLSLLLFLSFASRGFFPVGPKMVDEVNHFADVLPLKKLIVIYLFMWKYMYSVLPKKFHLNVNTTGFFAYTLKLQNMRPYYTLWDWLEESNFEFWGLNFKVTVDCGHFWHASLWLKLKLKNANSLKSIFNS